MQIGERIQRVSMGGLVALALVGATSAPASPTSGAWVSIPHITLEASIPEDEASVAGEVTEVRLFFSDAPLLRGASIRIVSSARKLMRSGPPAPDAEDPKQLSVLVAPALPPGSYVVQWRCIAADGHVMRGDFRFEVTG